MLESILNFREIDRSPYLTFLWAFLITNISLILATQVRYVISLDGQVWNLGGIFSVLFTIIPSTYFLTMVIRKEEKMEEEAIGKKYSKNFWGRHEKDIIMFLFFFLGVTLAFSVWSFYMSPDFFRVQISEVQRVQGSMTGHAIQKGNFDHFLLVTANNLQVMVFAFVFSILFGAGAVFILVWNASILGVYIGQLSKSVFHIPIVTMFFLPHGIPEVIGYLCAGLAGGLLSASILRCHKAEIIKRIFIDSMLILVVGIVFIVLAAGIETYL